MIESYNLGGGVIKDWKNPNSSDFKHDADVFDNWLVCYQKPGMKKIKDKQGRSFWFENKYNNQ